MSSNIHSISHVCVGINEFKDYYLNNNYNNNMFKPDGTLNSNYNSLKKLELSHKFSKTIGTIFLIMKNK